MKRTIFLFTLILALNMIPSANASQIVIDGYATIDYPATVKLKNSGCQNIPFNYVTDDDLPRENSVFIVAITPLESKRVYGTAVWFSTQTYLGERAQPPMARIGVLKVKICRKAFKYSSNSQNLTLASRPGKFALYFSASMTDPVNGSLIGEKTEIKRFIKFY
jgi:hypothetical protein